MNIFRRLLEGLLKVNENVYNCIKDVLIYFIFHLLVSKIQAVRPHVGENLSKMLSSLFFFHMLFDKLCHQENIIKRWNRKHVVDVKWFLPFIKMTIWNFLKYIWVNQINIFHSSLFYFSVAFLEVRQCQYEGGLKQPGESFHSNDCQKQCTCSQQGEITCQPTVCPIGLEIRGMYYILTGFLFNKLQKIEYRYQFIIFLSFNRPLSYNYMMN